MFKIQIFFFFFPIKHKTITTKKPTFKRTCLSNDIFLNFFLVYFLTFKKDSLVMLKRQALSFQIGCEWGTEVNRLQSSLLFKKKSVKYHQKNFVLYFI